MAINSYAITNRYKNSRTSGGSTTNPDAATRNVLASSSTFSATQRQASLGALAHTAAATNPGFAITNTSNRNIHSGAGDHRIVRGYIRRAEGETADPTSRYRLNFMFNPEMIQRSFIAYLDQQALDPFNTLHSGNLAAAPGILDFNFDLMFDRQLEVARDIKHPGTKIDYDYFDLVVRGVIPQAGNSSAIGDNGIMLVNPRNITVVFNNELQVMGKAYNAGVRFEKFSHTMTTTRMTISLQMKVLAIGPTPRTYNAGTTQATSIYKATVAYDSRVKVSDVNTKGAYALPDSSAYDTLFGTYSGGAELPTSAGGGTTGDIFVVGDSLMVGSGPYLKKDLPGRNVEIDALVGRNTDAGLAVLRAKGTAGLAQNVLVNLGTNDAQNASYVDKVTAVMNYLGPNRKVFWDTVWFGPAGSNNPEAVNAAIRQVAATHPNLVLINVNGAAAGQSGHLTGSGYQAKGQIEADHLKSTLPPATGTSGSHADWINGGMALAGVSGLDWFNGLSTIARRESNWDPNAQNNWDSNAAKGTPSIGLMQTIQPTFDAYKVAGHDNIRNPIDNVAAAIRYIQKRYGDISKVQQANPNLPPKGY